MRSVTLQLPTVIVLAEGKSPSDRNQARGHLFEAFIARVFAIYGYAEPTRESLNVTANGIELDVKTKHRLSGHQAVAECKAYSSSVPAGELSRFYGKLSALRLQDPSLFGWFVALPGLSPEGNEQADYITKHDPNVRVMTATHVVHVLREQGMIIDPPTSDAILADPAVAITPGGIYSVAKEVDAETRLPQAVRIWSANEVVPEPARELVAASTYSGDLDVLGFDSLQPVDATPPSNESAIVEVIGSNSDFEYQLPASPAFFIGRHPLLTTFSRFIAEQGKAGRVLVVNAQSGWGKSSLALQFKRHVMGQKGHAIVVDSRTASTPDYVASVLRKLALEAESKGLLRLPEYGAFSSLNSALATISQATWREPPGPLLVFFDQFESAFRDARLTQQFRDLALAVQEAQVPLIVGFAWKTDLIGWTESHPYRLRDEIRDRATVINVAPFGPSEVNTVLNRLARAAGGRLNRELRQRLREYSQGLPWLLKKLASHILRELDSGTSQEELVAEALNVQSLFESELAELNPLEQEALRTIARVAPIMASDAVDLFPASIVQSLLDHRLLVQVGERLDTYWDIFRDFLNTGRVPIQETYILRFTPGSVGKLLRVVVDAGGDLSVSDAAEALDTSEKVIFNLARELRQMNVLGFSPGRVKTIEDVQTADNVEEAVHQRISVALRRHRAYSILNRVIEERGGQASTQQFAEALPEAFPAVQAISETWLAYARAFLRWFEYAGLVSVSGGIVIPGSSPLGRIELLAARANMRQRRAPFPQGPPGPALDVLNYLVGNSMKRPEKESTFNKALDDILSLNLLVRESYRGTSYLASTALTNDGEFDQPALMRILLLVPGGDAVIDRLRNNPAASNLEVGLIVKEAYRASWADSTADLMGKYFRGWARSAGLEVAKSRPGSDMQEVLPLA
jgi:hypothetical protein